MGPSVTAGGLPLPVRSPSGTLEGHKMCLDNGEFAFNLMETIGVGATGKVKLGVHKVRTPAPPAALRA